MFFLSRRNLLRATMALFLFALTSQTVHAAVHGPEDNQKQTTSCDWGGLLNPLAQGITENAPVLPAPILEMLAHLRPPACYVPSVQRFVRPGTRAPPTQSSLR